MDANTALNTKVRRKLEDSFGADMTGALLNSHAQKLGLNVSLLSEDQYVQLAESLAQDQRVVELWGQSKAQFQALAWKGALRV